MFLFLENYLLEYDIGGNWYYPVYIFYNNECRPNPNNRKQFKILLTDVNIKGLLQLNVYFKKMLVALCNENVISNIC